MSTTLITGNTYPVKDKLRALGGKWDKAAGGWSVPTERAAEARAMVDAAGPVVRDNYRRGRRYGRRGAGVLDDAGPGHDGRDFYQNPRGRCEDAPCCGCCS